MRRLTAVARPVPRQPCPVVRRSRLFVILGLLVLAAVAFLVYVLAMSWTCCAPPPLPVSPSPPPRA